jgi:hypothetical protein
MVTQNPPAPRLFYGWIVMVACLVVTMVSSGTMMAFGVFITRCPSIWVGRTVSCPLIISLHGS